MKMYCFSRNISSSAPVSRSPSVTSLVVLNPSLTSQSPGKLLKKYLISEPHQVDQNTGVGGGPSISYGSHGHFNKQVSQHQRDKLTVIIVEVMVVFMVLRGGRCERTTGQRKSQTNSSSIFRLENYQKLHQCLMTPPQTCPRPTKIPVNLSVS